MTNEIAGPHPPAGWYADARGGQRYWDGSAWTDHTAPAPSAAVAPVIYTAYAVAPYGQVVAPKNPALSALATFFIVGLGQLLNGQVGKGIAFFGAAVFSAFLSVFLIGIPMLIGVWIWAMVDAYSTAKNWNLRHGIIS